MIFVAVSGGLLSGFSVETGNGGGFDITIFCLWMTL